MKLKKKSANDGNREPLKDISYYRLFMLNLHKVIACGFKLEQIFRDLRGKYEGDYIYGRMFIAETIIDIIETLDMVLFYLNALTGGRDIDLFYKLDCLKSQLNKCFDGSDYKEAALNTRGDSIEKRDALSILLGEIINYSTKVSIPADASSFMKLEDVSTAHDLLNYCYNCIFDILESCHRSIKTSGRELSARKVPIIEIPLSYLQQDQMPFLETELTARKPADNLYSNPGALKLREGIYEILNSEFYTPLLEQSHGDSDIQGMMFYSNETLLLYDTSDRFRNIITANICDAVGGNYINLLIASTAPHNPQLSPHQLIKKLLDWLDFRSFSGYGFTTASIKNITRNDMENHLNMLGKLLTFASSTKIPPLDDETVQQNIELFLENVV